MNADDYQKLATRTLIAAPERAYTEGELMLLWNALGLAGEAGEVCDTIKKAILHEHGLSQTELIKELGDVCWYLAALCTNLGLNLGDVMTINIEKLKVRYPHGWTNASSVARVDVEHTDD